MPVRFIVFLTISLIVPGSLFGNNLWYSGALQADDSLRLSVSQLYDTVAQNTGLDSAGTERPADTLQADTVTTPVRQRESPLEDKVTYSALDSMIIMMEEKKLYLYGDAQINYQNIELIADYIELDLGKEEVFARGVADTLGKVEGKPKFTQGDQTFDSDSMRYNFSSENGIIYHIITQEGEGYLHSEKTKRLSNKHIHIQDGKYTTCDAEHPHFYLALTKGIVIPEDKIITGPAYMVIADVPLKFIALPFGFFPNTTQRASGILIPTWGEEQRRGFYLRDFGWYQVLGNYADLAIQGDAYTKGSWSARTRLSYKLRYKFSGSFAFNYAEFKNDESGTGSKDYAIRWTHRQDAKANPTQNFSASVNFTSREFDQNYSYSGSQYLNSATSSSVSYTKRWPSTPFNLSLSANANQNRQTETVDLSLPTGSFNMSSIYPFRSKSGTGKYKWYENISLSYSSSFRNELNTYQEVLTQRETWDSLKTGFQHSIPLSVNLKLGKLITVSPSLSYRGNIYTRHIEIDEIVEYDSVSGDYIENVREVKELSYEQAINPSIGVSFTPKLYGMLQSTREDSYVEAIRHVLSPSVGMSYTPDMSAINNTSYYDTLYFINEEGELEYYKYYNKYEEELYTPPSSNGKSGSVRFALNNSLEMKVRPKNDTTGESKKVTLLDNLNLNTSWSPYNEKFKWSDVRLTGNTRLFNNKVNISANGSFTPYGVDSTGKKIDEFYINQEGGKLLRFTNMSINTSFTLRSQQGKDEKKEEETLQSEEEDLLYDEFIDGEMDFPRGLAAESYVDFDIPWSLNVRHSWSLTKTGTGERNVSHTVNMSGDISFTQKWKVGGQMNYDIEKREMSFTSLSIYRDLHCWEMRFTVVPFGVRRSYSFTIQAKGSLLRDLKYEKKPNWYDNF